MQSTDKLRNKLVKKIQQLPANKLKAVDDLLNEIENHADAKEKTLAFAGSWKDMDEELFSDLTINLHINRNNDRQIF